MLRLWWEGEGRSLKCRIMEEKLHGLAAWVQLFQPVANAAKMFPSSPRTPYRPLPPLFTPFSLHSFSPSHLTAVKGALGAIMWRRREEGRGGTPDSCSESLLLLFPFPNRKGGMCERGDRMFLHVRVRRRETNCCGQE